MANGFVYDQTVREQLMKLPWDQRIKLYTEDVLILHERLKDILEDILTFATPGSGVEILLLTGAGGAGKTGTLRVLRKRLFDAYLPLLLEDKNLIPFVFETMKAGGTKHFRWNVFYKQLGKDLNVPLLGSARSDVNDAGAFKMVRVSGRTYLELQTGVEAALTQRHTLFLAMDEIAHVFDGTDDDELMRHLAVFKTFSNFSNVSLLFSGGYQNQRLMDVTGQMSKRCMLLYLEPYKKLNGKIPEAYKRMTRTMAKEMPIESPPKIDPYMDVLFINSNGMAGTTKDILVRSASYANRQKKWSESCLERALFSDDAVVTIENEIEEGERRIEGSVSFVLAEKSRLKVENLLDGINAARARRKLKKN